MPTYSFENINTGEEVTIEMKISELDQFKKDNPELVQIFSNSSASIVDPVLLGVKKPPREFQKEVLGKIKKGSGRDNTLGTGRWEIPKF